MATVIAASADEEAVVRIRDRSPRAPRVDGIVSGDAPRPSRDGPHRSRDARVCVLVAAPSPDRPRRRGSVTPVARPTPSSDHLRFASPAAFFLAESTHVVARPLRSRSTLGLINCRTSLLPDVRGVELIIQGTGVAAHAEPR
jgi:hypothetical protein